jgi:hypothetical protein
LLLSLCSYFIARCWVKGKLAKSPVLGKKLWAIMAWALGKPAQSLVFCLRPLDFPFFTKGSLNSFAYLTWFAVHLIHCGAGIYFLRFARKLLILERDSKLILAPCGEPPLEQRI